MKANNLGDNYQLKLKSLFRTKICLCSIKVPINEYIVRQHLLNGKQFHSEI